MLLTSNVLLLKAILSLNTGLPKDLQVGFLHYKFLKLKYKNHRIMYVNALAVTALPCNSKIYFVTPKLQEILSNCSLFLQDNMIF